MSVMSSGRGRTIAMAARNAKLIPQKSQEEAEQ